LRKPTVATVPCRQAAIVVLALLGVLEILGRSAATIHPAADLVILAAGAWIATDMLLWHRLRTRAGPCLPVRWRLERPPAPTV